MMTPAAPASNARPIAVALLASTRTTPTAPAAASIASSPLSMPE
jgi:hypothetical protein